MMVLSKKCRVLAIGAHPDDIELGVGGFLHLLRHKWDAEVDLLILTAGVQSASPGQKPYEPTTRIQE